MPELDNLSNIPQTTTLEVRAAMLQEQFDADSGKIDRSIELLRHYNWLQIARRGTNLLKQRLTGSAKIHPAAVNVVGISGDLKITKLAKLIIEHRANNPSHLKVDLEQGRFVLMNHAVNVYNGGQLQPQELNQQTHLWRFQFHYHEFLLTQVAAGRWRQAANFLFQWLDDFAPEKITAKDDAWHPYCISRRVAAWIWLLFGGNNPDRGHKFTNDLIQCLLTSLVQQCEYLRTNLELDLGGNHLLENATALAIASCVIESDFSDQWERSATSIFERQLPIQILTHGEHFERTPVYHGHMLGNLQKIEICADTNSELQSVIAPYINPMLQHLRSIVHPDGEVPLFADSVFAEAPSTKELLASAQLRAREVADRWGQENAKEEFQGQYRVLQNDDAFVICDFGPIAADNLPAHGHCDALNLEVSIGGDRWIVDSGNFNYNEDSMRHYCRSSIAHNVVTFNHQNHASVWGKFRMGKRPEVGPIKQGVNEKWKWASAGHDGYKHLGRGRLERIVGLSDNAVACFDRGSIDGSVISGHWTGYVHFHPDIEITLDHADPAARRFQFIVSKTGRKKRLTVCAESAEIEQGWYCTEFGKRQVSSVLRYDLNASVGFLGWILHKDCLFCDIRDSRDNLQIKVGDHNPLQWS